MGITHIKSKLRGLVRDREHKVFVNQLRDSELFNAGFYKAKYPDVAMTKMDPAEHYVSYGLSENRLPADWASFEALETLRECDANWLEAAVAENLTVKDLNKKISDFKRNHTQRLVQSYVHKIPFEASSQLSDAVVTTSGPQKYNIDNADANALKQTIHDMLMSDFLYVCDKTFFDLEYYKFQTSNNEGGYQASVLDFLSKGRYNGLSPNRWFPVHAISANGAFEQDIETYIKALAPDLDIDEIWEYIDFIQQYRTIQSPAEMQAIFNERQKLRESEFFNGEDYLNNLDLTRDDMDAALHYIILGETYNAMPNNWFVPKKCYLKDRQDPSNTAFIETQLSAYLEDLNIIADQLAIEARHFSKDRLIGAVRCLGQTMPKSREGLLKLTRDYIAILRTGTFDQKFYIDNYGEYLGNMKDYPLAHFVAYGVINGALPNKQVVGQNFGHKQIDLETKANPYLVHIQKIEDRDRFVEAVFGDEMDGGDYAFLDILDEHFPNLSKEQFENIVRDYELLKFSGTLDVDLYEQLNLDITSTGLNPLEHFILYGADEGRWPCEWYDMGEGNAENPEYKALRKNPFAEYIRKNPAITRNIKSQSIKYRGNVSNLHDEIKASGLFDEPYYKNSIGVSSEDDFNAIEHYLKFGRIYQLTPRADFDPEWYWNTYSDCQELQIDPFVHYVRIGHKEKRNTQSTSSELTVAGKDQESRDRIQSLTPGARTPVFEEKRPTKGAPALRCFTWYLPQFHPCPENNEFWGEGFTEWTNVTTALPKYTGHVQPKLPSDFGFYDLRLTEIMDQQAKLAREFHIEGFAFYYYWFGGKRALQLPIENFLKSPEIDIGFFLCWANENWSRRWDGKDQDILLAQNHSPEDDKLILEDWKRHFDDPRYTRIDGKPVIALYRPDLIPNMKETVARWRAHAQTLGIGDLYLAAVNSFGYATAKEDGFDSWIEFPPHSFSKLKNVTMERDIPEDFSGAIYDYDSYIKENYDKKAADDLPTFRGAMPSWDNTARKKNKATIFDGSSPQKFQGVVERQIEKLKSENKDEEQILIVNAWNEWAEGTYMEPDRAKGYAVINALGRALTNVKLKCCIISENISAKDLKAFQPNFPFEILKPVRQKKGGVMSLAHQLCHYGKQLLAYDLVIFDPKNAVKSNKPKAFNLPVTLKGLEAISHDITYGFGQFSHGPAAIVPAKKPPKLTTHIMMEYLSLMGINTMPNDSDFKSVKEPIYIRTSAVRPILENAPGLEGGWLSEKERAFIFDSLLLYCMNAWGYQAFDYESFHKA